VETIKIKFDEPKSILIPGTTWQIERVLECLAVGMSRLYDDKQIDEAINRLIEVLQLKGHPNLHRY
jgi:hypothetical protein